jgi:ATP-dependent helicase HrpB
MANANQWLGGFLQGSRSLKDLQKLDLHQVLLSLFSFEEKKQIEALAPAYWILPTGTKAAISYGAEPTISVLLQEMFGAKETPKIAGGAIPLTIELLSPAKRPLQVTRDLASFWSATYPKIRSEMKAKYPRHFWPENPLESEPQRGARKRATNTSNHR